MIYSGEKIGALLAFSLYTNTKKLLSCAIPKSPDAIRCLDGIRAITAAWILFGHVVSFFLLSPTRNKDYIETVRIICHAETTSYFNNLYNVISVLFTRYQHDSFINAYCSGLLFSNKRSSGHNQPTETL